MNMIHFYLYPTLLLHIVIIIIIILFSSNEYVYAQDKVTVALDTYPIKVPLIIDGKIYNTPVQFTWDRYSRHELSPLNTVVYDDEGARYIFNQWSDLSKDTTRSITIDYASNGETYVQYIAYFDKQYRLLLIDGNNTREEWYNANTLAILEVDKIRSIDDRSRLVLSSWVSNDPSIVLPEDNRVAVVIDRSIVLKPIWKKQYYIDIKAVDVYGNTIDDNNNSSMITVGSGWYYEGSKAHIACIPLNTNSSLLFYSWRVINAIKSPDMDYKESITTITVDAPYTLECVFISNGTKEAIGDSSIGSTDKEQLIPSQLHRLIALTSYGTLIRDELVENNSIVKIDAPYIIPISNDTRYVFLQWNDGLLKDNTSNMVKVDSDKIIVAEYKKQYRVEVNGNAYGWYDSGSKIELRCPIPESNSEVKYEFVSWKSKDDSSDSIGLEGLDYSKESISITVNKPYKLSCSWKELFHVSIISPYREVKGEGFYEKGTQALIYVNESVDLGLGRKAYFIGWQGDINDKSNILSITVDKPYKIVALWREDSTQQYIILAILSMSVISASIMYIKSRVKQG